MSNILTQAEIVLLEQAYQASTRGFWRRGWKQLPNIQETKDWLARMVEFNAERPDLGLLVAMVDASDPPEVLENIEEYYCPALTGNGPTSEANAAFIELAHNWMPQLLAAARSVLLLREALAYAGRTNTTLTAMLAETKAALDAAPHAAADRGG